jgi:hypothetical protein
MVLRGLYWKLLGVTLALLVLGVGLSAALSNGDPSAFSVQIGL